MSFNVYALKKGDIVSLTGDGWGRSEGLEVTIPESASHDGKAKPHAIYVLYAPYLDNEKWTCMLVERDGKRVDSIIQADSGNMIVEYVDGSAELFALRREGDPDGDWEPVWTHLYTNARYVEASPYWEYIYKSEGDTVNLKEAKEYFGDVPVSVERLEQWLKEDHSTKPDLPEAGDRVRLTFADGHTSEETVTGVDERKDPGTYDHTFYRLDLENRLYPVWVFGSKRDEEEYDRPDLAVTSWEKVVEYKVGDVVPAYTVLGKKWLGRDGDGVALADNNPNGTKHFTTDRVIEWMED